jgi:hypothetical protein
MIKQTIENDDYMNMIDIQDEDEIIEYYQENDSEDIKMILGDIH